MATKPAGIQSLARSKHVFWCNYGVPGSGKTRLAGTAPKTLIIRPPTEHTDSIRTPENADEWIVNGWNDMAEAEEYIRHLDPTNPEYEWTWLDSISLFQDTGLDEIWADVIAAKPHRAQYGLDKGEYGVNMTRLARWVRSVVGADTCNIGITAHPFYGEDIEGNSLLMPYVQGKNMPEKICGYMNLVTYMEVKLTGKGDDKKRVRVLRSQGTDKYYAKDQFDAFGEDGKLVNPTVPKVMAAIEANRPAATKKKTTRPAKKRRRTTTK